MRFKLISFIILFLSIRALAFDVVFSSQLPTLQRAIIEHDIESLDNLNLDETQVFAAMLGMPLGDNCHGKDLKKWLDLRMNIIISEHEPLDLSYAPTTSSELILHPQVTVPVLPQDESPNSNSKIIMSNTGASIYLEMISRKKDATFRLDGIEYPVRSPMIGIFRVGPKLFYLAPELSPLAARILRISTYIHEAMHTSGHGSEVGLFHQICPEKVADFAGKASCDNYMNGPYGVQAEFIDVAIKGNRKTLTLADVLYLNTRIQSIKSRVLSKKWFDVPIKDLHYDF